MILPRRRKKNKFRLKRSGKARRHRRLTIVRQVAAPLPDGQQQYDVGFAAAYDTAYRSGYDEGFNGGFNEGHGQGYKTGFYEGGEGVVERMLPPSFIMPDVSLEAIVEAGLQQLRDRWVPLLETRRVAGLLQQSLEKRTPMSVVRLGDGELLTMAQDTLIPVHQVLQEGPFLEYAGIRVPDLHARDVLVQSVRQCNVLGIPTSRKPIFQPLAFSLFRSLGLDSRQMALTHSTINYSLFDESHLHYLVRGRKVLLAGNMAPAIAEIMAAQGVHIAGAIAPVAGIGDVERVMQEISACDFDLALVSAGIAAVPLVQRIATQLGKVALDFGHMADWLVKGKAQFRM